MIARSFSACWSKPPRRCAAKAASNNFFCGAAGGGAHFQMAICTRARPRYGAPMTENNAAIILQTVERAPQWVRRDLCSSDQAARTQAEETLAAMIAVALSKKDEPSA